MAIHYHLTTPDKVEQIEKNGLQPRIEKRGVYADGSKPGIYLFSDLITADDALTNWLADEMTGYTQAVAFAVNTDGIPLEDDPELAGSFIARQPISPERLSVVKTFDLGEED